MGELKQMPPDLMLDLRRLRYFVTVAEEQSFRRAADRLGMAQPPLSQQIMALEKQLNQRLFIRHPRSIELTDAGHALLTESLPLLQRAAEIPERLRSAAEGRTGTLHIGFTPATSLHPLLPRILRAFRAEAPDVELQFHEADTIPLCNLVAEAQIHAAFIRPPAPVRDRLTVERLVEEPILLAVPCEHHFSTRLDVSLAELKDEPFVMFERKLAPEFYDAILTACVDANFSPRVVHYAPQKSSAMMLAAALGCLTFVPASLQGTLGTALKLMPLLGPQLHATISLATRIGDAGAISSRFRRVCKTLLIQADGTAAKKPPEP